MKGELQHIGPFANALDVLDADGKVARKGWPADEYLYQMPGSELLNKPPALMKEKTLWNKEPVIELWTPTQADILARDWYIVSE